MPKSVPKSMSNIQKEREKTMSEQKKMTVAPSISREADEQECIALALSRAKERLINDTATAQEICYFLKLGTQKEELECLRIKQQIAESQAKVRNIENAQSLETLMTEAIDALKSYGSGFND